MNGVSRDMALVTAIEMLGAEIVSLRAELHIAHDGNLALRKLLREQPQGSAWGEVQEYMRQYEIESVGYTEGFWYAHIGNAEYSGETLRAAVLAAAEEWIEAQRREAQA